MEFYPSKLPKLPAQTKQRWIMYLRIPINPVLQYFYGALEPRSNCQQLKNIMRCDFANINPKYYLLFKTNIKFTYFQHLSWILLH